MSTDHPLPDGLYAEWADRTWEATTVVRPPDSVRVYAETQADPQFTPTMTGRWARTLPRADVRLFRLATYCRWRGARFRVEGTTSTGELSLGYLGRSETEARQLGLTKAEPGVYVGSAPPSEVTDLRQERTDLTSEAPAT